MAFGSLFDFADVFRREILSINKRRARLGRPAIELEDETGPDGTPLATSDGTVPLRPKDDSNVVGLALSGGGIRSAAFCLGTLQALREADVLDKVDYLSTVSGGGYIGSSMTNGMTETGGRFPFRSMLSEDESPSLQHIRDHSNFLFPRGARDFWRNAAIYVRGLFANAVLILPFLLILAAVTILVAMPQIRDYDGIDLYYWHLPPFALTAAIGGVLVLTVIVWGILRSGSRDRVASEVTDYTAKFVGVVVCLFLLTAFCELQPYILGSLLQQDQTSYLHAWIEWIRGIALALAPVAAAVAFVAEKLGEGVKSALESERIRDQLLGYAGKAVIYLAAVILPLVLWALYLQFSYWGVCFTKYCMYYYAPDWLVAAAKFFPGSLTSYLGINVNVSVIAQLYIVISIVCVIISCYLRPNANSLHPLYRDRLGEAFLFKPEKTVERDPKTGTEPPLRLTHRKLSELSEEHCPYQLINTALNVQGSKQVNRRGRNADFFLFSRNFVGSRATDYVATEDIEKVMTGLDLGSAMSVSGAAASSNMGSATIKPLTATLAVLNIRLGYWLRNPRHVKTSGQNRGKWNRWANYYFLLEFLGKLRETSRSIYLTDGGHIENLGIYELLRRRCKVIIAVDAEADPEMAFGSFNVLVRYALIDLGVRIDLPWQQVTDMTKATGKAIDEEGDTPKHSGPHVAIGDICYPGGRRGVLIYIKSSLTGDENDYIFHYKKRYGSFPQETTLDQLFSEEQFEAYRALGFHAAYRFFDRRDLFAYCGPDEKPVAVDDLKFLDDFFPLRDPGATSRPHATFADWLKADCEAKVARNALDQEVTSSPAVLARATTRFAQAAEKGVERLDGGRDAT